MPTPATDSSSQRSLIGDAPESPRTVEIDLEAREGAWEIAPGQVVEGWMYNGQVPGPTIEARVGDTLVVRLKNSLREATTLHWHGVRLPADMDGTSLVQLTVGPGESFEYRFALVDAGTYWYHSHNNETVQVERGLYGALIVRDETEPVVDAEQVLVLDDILLDENGEFASFDGMQQRHDGRHGNTRLVNGRVGPEISIAAGQIERWRIVNASNARYILLSIGRPFRLLGTDGGLVEEPITMSDVLLTPGDRVDIAVGPFDEGDTVSLGSLPCGHAATEIEQFASIRVGERQASKAFIPDRLRTIERLAPCDALPTRQVLLGHTMSADGAVDFTINDEMHLNDHPATVGELQVWDILNNSHMDHPFHLHGFFFQVLSVDGVPPEFVSWEDTCNVPANSRVLIAWMPDDRPGRWMYHCHILEHHAAGMMASFEVVRPGERVMHAGPHSCHT